jgi:predicted glutamine amidotransferase
VCRLFGMSGGRRRMHATFWLLEAADSLAEQSRRNPDGYGLATFADDGTPEIKKRPAAAYEDKQFAREAKHEESRTFVAHVRYASTGKVALENTHPFEQKGRVFAHNGVIAGLDALDAQLGDHRSLVRGETDSERFFALITKEIDAAGGDVGEGIVRAVRWVARELPLYSLNFVLADESDLWVLRYPETHGLLMLERAAGGPTGVRHLDAASRAGTVRVRSAALATQPSVIFATEQMDEDAGWRMLDPGELIHVDADLRCNSLTIHEPPAHLLTLADLEPHAAASQHEPEPLSSRAAPSARPST